MIKYIYNYKHSSANIYGTYKQYHYNLKEAGSFEIEQAKINCAKKLFNEILKKWVIMSLTHIKV